MFGYISHYEGMETGEIVARVVEGRVNKVGVVHVDDEGNPRKDAGEVAPDVILRELPFKACRLCPCLSGCLATSSTNKDSLASLGFTLTREKWHPMSSCASSPSRRAGSPLPACLTLSHEENPVCLSSLVTSHARLGAPVREPDIKGVELRCS